MVFKLYLSKVYYRVEIKKSIGIQFEANYDSKGNSLVLSLSNGESSLNYPVGHKCNYKGPYKRETEGDFATKEGHVTTEARC